MNTLLSTMFGAIVLMPAVAGASCSYSTGDVQVQLRAEAFATRRDVTLGDIAIVRTHDLDIIRKLVALPLGSAPRSDTETVLRRDTVARWVRSQFGVVQGRIEWLGADETRLRTASQTIHANQMEQAARAALLDIVGQGPGRFSVESVGTLTDVHVPAGPFKIVPRSMPPPGFVEGRVTVWLDLEVGAKHVRSIPVSFNLQRAYARVQAPSGASVPAAQGLPAPDAVKDAPRPSLPLVARGDWVVLQLKAGAVEIERRTQALQDGLLGETVKVRGESGPVSARITAAGRVEALL